MIDSCRCLLLVGLLMQLSQGEARSQERAVTTATAASSAAGSDDDFAGVDPLDSRQWSRGGEAILKTDLSLVQPESALVTGKRCKQTWKVIPYATQAFAGRSLSAYAETGAPTVSLPLETTGWHAVYVGVGTVTNGIAETNNVVRAKLSGDDVFRRMSNHQHVRSGQDRRDSIEEVFLTVADLEDQSVEIAQAAFQPAAVMYVKLVPLTDDEVAAWQAGDRTEATRPLIATFDGHSWIWPYRPRIAAHLKETFEGFQHSDFTKWWFQVLGADLVCYPTKVGTVPGMETEDFFRWEYKEYVDSLKALFAAGVNPLQVACDAAREQGVEFHIMIRPGAWQGTAALDETFSSRFFREHPEWRCVDRDGTPTFYMSYAVPEVRQQILDVLREALAVKPDGVGFLFHRGLPLMLWEDAFCEQFQQAYGEDARSVTENDPRIAALRGKIMTGFLRQVRDLLDEVQQDLRLEKPLTISVATFSKESDNQKYGLAVEQWIDQQLVSDIAVGWFAHHTSFNDPGGSLPDMAYYRRITAGKDVGLYPFVIGWKPGTPRSLCQTVTRLLRGGCYGNRGLGSGGRGRIVEFDALDERFRIGSVRYAPMAGSRRRGSPMVAAGCPETARDSAHPVRREPLQPLVPEYGILKPASTYDCGHFAHHDLAKLLVPKYPLIRARNQ